MTAKIARAHLNGVPRLLHPPCQDGGRGGGQRDDPGRVSADITAIEPRSPTAASSVPRHEHWREQRRKRCAVSRSFKAEAEPGAGGGLGRRARGEDRVSAPIADDFGCVAKALHQPIRRGISPARPEVLGSADFPPMAGACPRGWAASTASCYYWWATPTGQGAWCKTARLTEPSIMPRRPPRPRAPTTSNWAPDAASSSALRGPPCTTWRRTTSGRSASHWLAPARSPPPAGTRHPGCPARRPGRTASSGRRAPPPRTRSDRCLAGCGSVRADDDGRGA